MREVVELPEAGEGVFAVQARDGTPAERLLALLQPAMAPLALEIRS